MYTHHWECFKKPCSQHSADKIAFFEISLKNFGTENPIMECKRRVGSRLLYSVVTTAFVPFFYGIGLLCVQAFKEEKILAWNTEISTFFRISYGILFLGSLVSNIIFYYIRLEKTLLFCISSMLFSLGFFTVTYNSLYTVYIGRFIIGLAAGIAGNNLPCYLSLVSPLELRGLFSTLFVVGLISGLLVFNVFFSVFEESFKITMTCFSVLAVANSFLCLFCVKLKPTKNEGSSSLYALVTNPRAFKSLFFIAAFHCAQNLSGINQISLCPESIYGPSYQMHVAVTLFIGVAVGFFSGYLSERVGRKVLTLASCSIVVFGCIALFFQVYPAISSYILSFGFNLGLSNIPYILLAEIFPEDLIAPGALFGTTCNYMGAIISVLIPQGGANQYMNPSFAVYSLYITAFSILVYFFFKETMGIRPQLQ